MSTFHKDNRPSVNCLYDFLLASILLVSNSSRDLYHSLRNNVSFSDLQFKYNSEDHKLSHYRPVQTLRTAGGRDFQNFKTIGT